MKLIALYGSFRKEKYLVSDSILLIFKVSFQNNSYQKAHCIRKRIKMPGA